MNVDAYNTQPVGENYKISASAYFRTPDDFIYGVVGVTSGNLRYETETPNVWTMNSIAPFDMMNLATYVQPYVDALTALNIKKIILLSNLGNANLEKALVSFFVFFC
jgi:hypothetical protein